MYKYSIEEFINNQWITNIRLYQCKKDLNDFDLHNHRTRRNTKLID